MKNGSRVAIVTGGNKGIGKEISHSLAGQDIVVCIAARSTPLIEEMVQEIRDTGGEAFGFTVNVQDVRDIDDMVKTIRDEIGEINILVNNAGIAAGGKQLWEMSVEEWWKVMEVNVKGPMVLCNRVIPSMIERDSGVIINLCSYAGARSTPMASAYSVSKTALMRLSDTLAASLVDHNISVFPISPGLVHTNMTKDVPVFQSLPDSAWTPVEETGKLVVKLISGKYNSLSGRFIHVNNDLDEMLEKSDEINEGDIFKLRLVTFDGFIE